MASFLDMLFSCSCIKKEKSTFILSIDQLEESTIPHKSNIVSNSSPFKGKEEYTICTTNNPLNKSPSFGKSTKISKNTCKESAIFTVPNQLKDLNKHQIPSEREIPQSIITSAKVLHLTNHSKHSLIKINPEGIMNQTLKAKNNNGVVYFWTRSQYSNQFKEKIDYEFDIEIEAFNSAYLFVIYYNIEELRYQLKFNPNMNIEKNDSLAVRIPHGKIVSLGKKTMLYLSDEVPFFLLIVNKNMIEITTMATSRRNSFNSMITNTITIGRNESCNISFPELIAMSDVQTTITYNQLKKTWNITDGTKESESLNGTWILSDELYELYDKTQVKIGTNLLDVSLQ